MKAREKRTRVRLDARMRWDADWSTVSILNVSPHGMLLHAPRAPRPGSYLDIRREAQWYTVRTVWVSGQSFGVRAQDVIDIPKLIAPRPARAGQPPAPGGDSGPSVDRRRAVRQTDAVRSQAVGRTIQFLFAVGGVALAGGVIASGVGAVLKAPLDAVRAALTVGG